MPDLPNWQADPNSRATLRNAVDRHLAFVVLHKRLADSEAQPCAMSTFRCEEGLEDARQNVRRDTAPRVTYAQVHLLGEFHLLGGDRDCAATLRHCLSGVQQKVDQDLR